MTKESFHSRSWRLVRTYPLGALGAVVLLVALVAMVFPGLFVNTDPYRQDLSAVLTSPSGAHWFGTDELGRDVFARVVYGTRVTLGIALAANLLAAVAGTLLGLVSGYSGGLVDAGIMRALDVFLAFPGILLAIGFLAVAGAGPVSLVVGVALFSFPLYARVTRASALSVRSREYIDAAVSIGRRPLGIIGRHVVPNVMGPVLVVSVVRLADCILTVASLSFLGLGMSPEVPEWGSMLSTVREYMLDQPTMAIFPGTAIALMVLATNLVGQAVTDIVDPHQSYTRGRNVAIAPAAVPATGRG